MKKSNIIPFLAFACTFILAFYLAACKVDFMFFFLICLSVILLIATIVLYSTAFDIWNEKDEGYISEFTTACCIALSGNLAFIHSVKSVLNLLK
jgi:predicted membrane channel-forming protein YqfA (hemolysin III family)